MLHLLLKALPLVFDSIHEFLKTWVAVEPDEERFVSCEARVVDEAAPHSNFQPLECLVPVDEHSVTFCNPEGTSRIPSGTRLKGEYMQKEVMLKDFILGTAAYNHMSALVSEARNQPTDGLLSVLQLGPIVLYLDFDNNFMSWKD